MRTTILLLFCTILFAACANENKYEISGDKYEKTKASLEEIERENPGRFLTVSGGSKKNLLRQTVINGKITNNAKTVSYKDINIKLRFFSKTGALLEEDEETIFETIHPGSTEEFKTKYFAPKGTDSVSLTVLGAKY